MTFLVFWFSGEMLGVAYCGQPRLSSYRIICGMLGLPWRKRWRYWQVSPPLWFWWRINVGQSVVNDISSINIYREEKHANRASHACQKFDPGRIPPFLHLVLLPIQPLKNLVLVVAASYKLRFCSKPSSHLWQLLYFYRGEHRIIKIEVKSCWRDRYHIHSST